MTTSEYDQMLYEMRVAEGTKCASCEEDHGPSDPIGYYYDEYLHFSCCSWNAGVDA